MMKLISILIIVYLFTGMQQPAESQDKLVVFYNGFNDTKTPSNSGPTGPTNLTILAAAKKANIQIIWTSYSGSMVAHQRDLANFCYAGYIRTKDREKFLKFSDPIGLIDSHYILNHKKNSKLNAYTDFKVLITENKKNLVLMNDVSYGEYIDSLIKKFKIKRLKVSPQRLLRILLTAPEKYTIISKNTTPYIREIKIYADNLTYRNNLDGLYNERSSIHMACTLKTEDRIIKLFNQHLPKIDGLL